MNVKSAYEQATNVDLDKEKRLWDARGKGYYGEFLVFRELYSSAYCGTGKILMNLDIPVEGAKTTEVDLILIHETGLYVFEVKHYKGTIYGKGTDSTWTQYFKTTSNSYFKNPISQNRRHIKAIKQLNLGMPIHSCIVFTNAECDIRVTNSYDDVDVFPLRNISTVMQSRFRESKSHFSVDEIDEIFNKLSVYSKMRQPVVIDGNAADFATWTKTFVTCLDGIRNQYISRQEELEKENEKRRKFQLVFAVACMVLSFLICTGSILWNMKVCSEYVGQKDKEVSDYIEQKEDEYSKFMAEKNAEVFELKKKFLHVDMIGNDFIDALNSYVEISEIELTPLTDDAVNFSARVARSTNTYGFALTQNSKYIVITTSGKVFEYNVFGKHLTYYRSICSTSTSYTYFKLKKTQFYGISNPDEIAYVKVTGVELYKLDSMFTIIKNNLEIELYSK